MREYEMTLIYHTDDEVQKKTVDKVKSILDASSVKVGKEEDLGVRDLAYDIRKQSKGKYTFSIINADPDKIVDIENKFRLENGLLKFLFVKKEN